MLTAKTDKMRLGLEGESAAADFLEARGWSIVARNWRQGPLELDLICEQGQTVVFVEVKTRRAGGLTGPAEAFSREKQRRLVNAARAWLAENNAWSRSCRFDLVLVTGADNSFSMELVSDVIQLTDGAAGAAGDSVSGRNTNWQPW